MPQKLSSHVVGNGSSVEIAPFARMGNSLAAVNQELSQGSSAKLRFKPQSQFSWFLLLLQKSCPFQKSLLSYMGPWPSQGTQCRLSGREMKWKLLCKSFQKLTYYLTQCSRVDLSQPFRSEGELSRCCFFFFFDRGAPFERNPIHFVCACEQVFSSFTCWNVSVQCASLAHHSSPASSSALTHLLISQNLFWLLPQLTGA